MMEVGMMDHVFLHGIRLANFRAFGPNVQTFAPLRQFNFFVGANNSGKSAVLNFISRFLPITRSRFNSGAPQKPISELDYHNHKRTAVSVEIGFRSKEFFDRIGSSLEEGVQRRIVIELERLRELLEDHGLVWVRQEMGSNDIALITPSHKDIRGGLSHQEWNQLWRALTRHSGGE